ncbi:MAG TPA: hypothetical protein VM537_19610 [Anaerolineae bacterium]|nr:hypothetical protein [Anaerolineae bacterium]
MDKYQLTPENLDNIVTYVLHEELRPLGYTYTREQRSSDYFEWVVSYDGDDLVRVLALEHPGDGTIPECMALGDRDAEDRRKRQNEIIRPILDRAQYAWQFLQTKRNADLAREAEAQAQSAEQQSDEHTDSGHYNVGWGGVPGRPRNEDDDWACRQLWECERDREEVFDEWRRRIGPRAKRLADLRDSFNKAVREQRWRSMQE